MTFEFEQGCVSKRNGLGQLAVQSESQRRHTSVRILPFSAAESHSVLRAEHIKKL